MDDSKVADGAERNAINIKKIPVTIKNRVEICNLTRASLSHNQRPDISMKKTPNEEIVLLFIYCSAVNSDICLNDSRKSVIYLIIMEPRACI